MGHSSDCACEGSERSLQELAPELAWRPLQLSDAPALQRLHRHIESHEDVGFRTSLAECQAKLEDWVAISPETVGAWNSSGDLITYGALSIERTLDGFTHILCEGGVHPQWRDLGLGRAMLHWQMDTAALVDSQGSRVQIEVVVDEDNPYSTDLLIRHDFSAQRWHHELRRALGDLPELREPGNGVELVRFDPRDIERVRKVHNRGLAHFQAELNQDSWKEALEYVVPEWSFLAVHRANDRTPVVGYLLASQYTQEWNALGWREAYIGHLGVDEQWRHQGIATALIIRAMQTHKDAGLDFTALGVDTVDDRQEFGLFTPLGFQPDRRSVLFARER